MSWQDGQELDGEQWQSGAPVEEPKQVDVNPFVAAWQSSIFGLTERRENPTEVMPKDSGFLSRQAYNLTQMALDSPFMVMGAAGGAIAGGAAGTAVPVVGNVAGAAVGGGAGAFAVPTAIRQTLMDYYANGSIKSFSDLWHRALPVLWDTTKAGAVGGITVGTGKVIGPLAEAATKPLVETVSPAVASGAATGLTLAGQAATLASTGAALDGHLPTATDFEDSAALLFGLHYAVEGAGKLRSIYAKTGIAPADVLQDARRNPGVAQDLLSSNIETPEDYKAAIDTKDEPKKNELSVPGFGNVKIDQSKDIPWAGGSSEDGKTVYFQKGLSLVKTINGKEYNFAIPGAIHELTERRLEDAGQSYTQAHKAAELAEDSWVKQNWPDISDQYENHWKDDIQFAADRAKSGDVTVPQDLVKKPYAHPDNPLEQEMHDEVFGGGKGRLPPEADLSNPEDAKKAILSRLSIGETNDQGEPVGDRLERYYKNLVDDIFPIKKMVKELAPEGLPAIDDPGKLAQLLNGLSAKADSFINDGTRDFETYNVNGKGLKEILKPAENDLNSFRAYWVALRALELSKRGITTGVSEEAAKTLATDPALKAKYDPVLKELRAYRENLLNYGKDIIGERAIEKMLSDNKNYAPFQRVMERMSVGSTKAQPFNPIKAIKGSERSIIDPLESLVKQTYQIISLTERNAVNKAIAKLPEKFPDAKKFVRVVPKKLWPIDVQAEEIARAMKEQGIAGDPDQFTIFRPQALTPADNQLAYYENGKKTIIEVPQDVANSIKGLDRETVAPWVRMLGLTSQALRIGTTLTPDFQMRHMLRMAPYSFLYSEKLALPFTGLLRGALSMVKGESALKEMEFAGAAHANVQSFSREQLQGTLDKITQEHLQKSSWNVVGHGISKLQAMSQFMDNAWRLGEYKSVLTGDTKAAKIDAAYKARTVIVDLAQSGARMKSLNAITAFQATIINDGVRMMQALKEGADQMKSGDMTPLQTGIFARIAVGIVLPSVLLWAANRKNEAVQNMAHWEKNTYWLIPTGDKPGDTVLRYPKPFGVGVLFGSGVERALDLISEDDPKAFDEFAKQLVESMVPTEFPNFVTPPIEQFANKSLFTGGPIIPHDRENMLPAYQYSPYTTETAKLIGKFVGMLPYEADKSGGLASPAVIENYVRGWGGTMAMYALQASDVALKKAGLVPDIPKPTATLSDIPFVKAFVARYPSSGAQPVQDFYENLNRVEEVQKTVQKLITEGNIEEAMKIQQTRPYDMLKMQEIGQSISTAQQLIRNVYADPNMSPDDKRQIIDASMYQVIEMSGHGNQLYEDTKKSLH